MQRLGVILSFVVVIFFRFFQLGSVPEGLTKDEAYYGYDAYSIMTTGKDIWGNSLPLRFKSTGEYKLNLTYFIIPALSIFDLSELSVRLPSAVFGALTLPVLYLTLRTFSIVPWLSLGLTVIFAFSPWSFGMSRLFYESNVGLFFVALGFYGLLKQFVGKPGLAAGLAPFALALSSYLYGPYLYIGAFMILAAVLFKKLSPKSLLLYALVLFPLLVSLSGGPALKRLDQEWALKMPGYAMETDTARMNCYLSFNKNSSLAKLCYPFWNKPVNQIKEIMVTAARSVSPEFLFFQGVNTYVTPDKYGAYPTSLIFFYFFGFIALSRRLASRKHLRSPVVFLLLALAVSTLIISLPGRVELYRDPVGLYLLFIFMGLGASWFVTALKQSAPRLFLPVLILLFSIIAFDQARYLLEYFTSYTKSNPLVFSSDARQIYDYLGEHRDYDYLIDRKFHGPIYAAFYWKLDPRYFQTQTDWTEPDNWGWVNAKSIGNVYSTEFTIEELLCKKKQNPESSIKALIVSDPDPRYNKFSSLKTYDFSGSLHLHDIYDIDFLYQNLPREEVCP